MQAGYQQAVRISFSSTGTAPERHQNYTMLVQQIKSGVARSLILASGLELAKKKKKKNEFAVEHAHRAQDEESQILQYKQRTPN